MLRAVLEASLAMHAATRPDWLRNHRRWQPDWTTERPRLMWYLTFEDQPALHAWSGRAGEHLHHVRTVDVIPQPWLHLTLCEVGFVDEVTPADLEEIVARVSESLDHWQAPDLTLGPVATMDDCLVLPAGPESDLKELWARLRATHDQVLGPSPVGSSDGFEPHVSIAYVNRPCPAAFVTAPVAPLAEELTSARVTGVTLAVVTRHAGHYEWSVHCVVPLGEDA